MSNIEPWKYRCRISNDKDYLDRLNKRTGWTPSSTHIRPSAEVIAEKVNFLNDILPKYQSEKDFIIVDVFDCRPGVDEGSELIMALDCSDSGIGDNAMLEGGCANLCSETSVFGKDVTATTSVNETDKTDSQLKFVFKPNKYP